MSEIAYRFGEVTITFTDPSLLKKFSEVIEDRAKVELLSGNHEKVIELLQYLINLQEIYEMMRKEMEGKNDTL